METSTLLIIIGGSALVILIIVVVLVLLQQKRGGERRITGLQQPSAPQRGRRGGTYVPPAKAPPIRPPSPPAQAGATNLSPRPPWDSGTGGVVPPEVIPKPTPPPAAPVPAASASGGVNAEHRLTQEVAKLRSNGYNAVTLARRPDIEEYCLLVRVARSDGENVSIHLICERGYPALAPRLVATIEVISFDSHGEIITAEQRLALESPVLQAWGPGSSLLAVVNSILSTLPHAALDQSAPSTEEIFSRYSETIA